MSRQIVSTWLPSQSPRNLLCHLRSPISSEATNHRDIPIVLRQWTLSLSTSLPIPLKKTVGFRVLDLTFHLRRLCLMVEKRRTLGRAPGNRNPFKDCPWGGTTITAREALKFSSSFSVFSSVKFRSLSAWLILDSRV